MEPWKELQDVTNGRWNLSNSATANEQQGVTEQLIAHIIRKSRTIFHYISQQDHPTKRLEEKSKLSVSVAGIYVMNLMLTTDLYQLFH